jgi:hypothetical protein
MAALRTTTTLLGKRCRVGDALDSSEVSEPEEQMSAAASSSQAKPTRQSARLNRANRTAAPRALASTSQKALSQISSSPIYEGVDVKLLPSVLDVKSTGLSSKDITVLRKKQQRLRTSQIADCILGDLDCSLHSSDVPHVKSAFAATLVFAQEEAGTAVCISPDGILLTCSHCIAESSKELNAPNGRVKWLMFSDGSIVMTRCLEWDPKRDLALLQIVAAQVLNANVSPPLQNPTFNSSLSSFPYIQISPCPPPRNVSLFCIGHPGSEDLEANRPGVKTSYPVLSISQGRFKGLAKGQDPQDNSKIGALKHDCWTYWGHSGAPLIQLDTDSIVGLHSSWDDQTAMRRGVPLQAIIAFLRSTGEGRKILERDVIINLER